MALPPTDIESGPTIAVTASETSPLLVPPSPQPRPSYRRRRISSISVVESYRARWWTGVLGGFLAILLLIGGVAGIILTRGRGRHAKTPDDTPDFSKLPPPAPGLRNSNYLVSGYGGAVASEVDVCSEIGVEGAFIGTP